MADWNTINSTMSLPSIISRKLSWIAHSTLAIDFGSGAGSDMLQFSAREIVRYDTAGAIGNGRLPNGSSLDQIFEVYGEIRNVTFVAVRSLSVLDSAEFFEVCKILSRHQLCLRSIVICDYHFNNLRAGEYLAEPSIMGEIHRVGVQWSDKRFAHYTPSQLAGLMPLPLLYSVQIDLPAVRRKKDSGAFLWFRANED